VDFYLDAALPCLFLYDDDDFSVFRLSFFHTGVPLSVATQLFSYFHLRKSSILSLKAIEARENLDRSIDILESIENDQPRGRDP
jgi:hypothetical protein